jgi:hypothetical protein
LEIQKTPDATNGPNTGEPVFYWHNGTGLTKYTYNDLPPHEGNVYDLQTVRNDFYMKIKDVTFGGVVPIQNMPMDDPSTGFTSFSMTFTDDNSNFKWDPGEAILTVMASANLEGLVDLNNPAAYGGDPVAWFMGQGVSDTQLATYLQSPADADLLRAAIVASGELTSYAQFLSGNSVYYRGPDIVSVWNAYTAAGADAYLPGSPTVLTTSTGSVWWYWMNEGLSLFPVP